jgi:hypothetical protein
MTADQKVGAAVLLLGALWFAARWFNRYSRDVIAGHVQAALERRDSRYDLCLDDCDCAAHTAIREVEQRR